MSKRLCCGGWGSHRYGCTGGQSIAAVARIGEWQENPPVRKCAHPSEPDRETKIREAACAIVASPSYAPAAPRPASPPVPRPGPTPTLQEATNACRARDGRNDLRCIVTSVEWSPMASAQSNGWHIKCSVCPPCGDEGTGNRDHWLTEKEIAPFRVETSAAYFAVLGVVVVETDHEYRSRIIREVAANPRPRQRPDDDRTLMYAAGDDLDDLASRYGFSRMVVPPV